MKTSTKLMSGTLALAVVAVTIATSTSALAFRGDGAGRSFERPSLQLSHELPALSEAEKDLLIYGQQEERLARDVYLALYEQYGERVFANIARSEDRHIDAIGRLLDAYDIPQTEGYGELQSLYDEMIEKGSISLKDALEVGVSIEIFDIKDLDETIAETENGNIKTIYENLRKGSIKHLNAYVRNLQQNGFETDIDWEEYTSQESIDDHGRGNGKGMKGKGRGNGKWGNRGGGCQ